MENGEDLDDSDARYEFRVWGEQSSACETLASLAEREIERSFDDLYLLNGDPARSIKVRAGNVKVKCLEDERLGFQRWSTTWFRSPDEAPAPLGPVLADLQRCDPGSEDYRSLIADVGSRPEIGDRWRPILVTKIRRRFRFGSIRAETTDVEIDGQSESLVTVAIEGPDLLDLVELREHLGLGDMPNLALHLAVDPQHN